MTTIVKVGKAVAIDSRLTDNGVVLADDFVKCADVGPHIYLFVGDMHKKDGFFDVLENDAPKETLEYCKGITGYKFYKENGTLEKFSYDEKTGSWALSLVNCHTYCAGSGRKYAYGAIEAIGSLGYSCDDEEMAKMAIQAASKNDMYTGGDIHSWEAHHNT